MLKGDGLFERRVSQSGRLGEGHVQVSNKLMVHVVQMCKTKRMMYFLLVKLKQYILNIFEKR